MFPFSGTPSVTLTSSTYRGDGSDLIIRNEDVAYDAVAFQPLNAKPANLVVALGDSFSSGEGSSPTNGSGFYPESDNNGDDPDLRNACHRSRSAWSRLANLRDSSTGIGARSDIWSGSVEYQMMACSGAQTENVLPLYSSAKPPRNAFGDLTQGQFRELSQLDRGFVDKDTTLVTISVGGNDARFSDVLGICILDLDCRKEKLKDSTVTAEVEIPGLINGKVKDSVRTTIQEIRAKAPNAKIVLMGYPRVFETGDACWLVDTFESAWISQMADLLDSNLQTVVADLNRANGSTYVWFSDPRVDFNGHSVCRETPTAFQGLILKPILTPGDDISAKYSAQSFHPNAYGQTLYAAALNRTLRSIGL